MANPFQDLIPSKPQDNLSPVQQTQSNPFSDLIPQQSQQVSTIKPQESVTSNIGKKAATMVGAVSTTAANAIQGINDTAPWLLENLNAISPETAEKWYKINEENVKDLKVSPEGDQSDIFNKSAAENPTLYAGTKLASDVGAVAAPFGAINKLGALSSNVLQAAPRTAGVLGRAVGSGLLSQATVNPEDKNKAFGVGFALSPVADAAGALIGKLGTKATVQQDLLKSLDDVSTSKVNNAYNAVKKMDFVPEDKIKLDVLKQNVINLTNNTKNMSDQQTRLLNNLVSKLNSAKSHSDVLKTLQSIGKETRYFKGLEASDELYNGFKGVKTELESVLNQAAIRNGVSSALNDATQLAKQSKITGKIFKGLEESPEAFNFKTASKKLGIEIEKYTKIPEMKQTTEVLKGLKKLTDTVSKSYSPGAITGAVAGSSLGFSLGFSVGGPVGGWLGATAGGITGAAFINTIKNLSSTPGGQEFLKSLIKPGIVQQDLRNIVKALMMGGANKASASEESDGG